MQLVEESLLEDRAFQMKVLGERRSGRNGKKREPSVEIVRRVDDEAVAPEEGDKRKVVVKKLEKKTLVAPATGAETQAESAKPSKPFQRKPAAKNTSEGKGTSEGKA